MKRFIEGVDRSQATLLPECLDDWVDESNPVRVVDAFVDALDLKQLSFDAACTQTHQCCIPAPALFGELSRGLRHGGLLGWFPK